MKTKHQILNVPTNIITGFLGSGKTSAILHLLRSKPEDERWAVLVNEFGEIGVDGSLFKGQHIEQQGVFIHEVPGGCMCCTAGVPMQVALNKLLTRARPDRLLIEPTGLGHPFEVLAVLSGQQYRDILSIQKIVTLVDARNLADQRYTDHAIFQQQVAIADIIVGNKSDLCQEADRNALITYASEQGAPYAKLLITEQGMLDPCVLQGATRTPTASSHHQHHQSQAQPSADRPIPESGYMRVENQGEGYKSIGWRFSPKLEFDRDKLYSFLSGIHAERMKAVFITGAGTFGYNLTSDALSEIHLDACTESRIEIIATDIDPDWEQQLLDCISPNSLANSPIVSSQ